jgi:hypothetical protein
MRRDSLLPCSPSAGIEALYRLRVNQVILVRGEASGKEHR